MLSTVGCCLTAVLSHNGMPPHPKDDWRCCRVYHLLTNCMSSFENCLVQLLIWNWNTYWTLLMAVLHTPYWVYSGWSLCSVDCAVKRFSNVIPPPLSTFAFVSFVLTSSCPFQIIKHFSRVLFERFMVSSLTLKSSMNFSLVYII